MASPPVFLDAGPVTLHPVETDPEDDADATHSGEASRQGEREEESDLDFCHRLVNDERVRAGLTLYRPQSLAEEREFVESLDDGVRLIARADGERVGVVDLVHVDEAFGIGELGYFFDPEFWGNGYATAAAARVVTYGFDERRLHKVFARVLEPNTASQGVLERLGFTQEGRLRDQAFVRGEHVDMLRYGLLESEWDGGE